MIFLVFGLSVFLTGNSFGQKLNLGIKGGLNISDVSNKSDNPNNFIYTRSARTGFNVYLFYDAFNFRNVSISAEAGYSQKGFNNKGAETNEFGVETMSYEIRNKINYIDISVLAKIIMRSKSFSPYLIAGPYLGIKTKSELTTSIDSILPPISSQKSVIENFKSTTFGFKTGVGSEFPLKKVSLIAEVRFAMDLSNAYEDDTIGKIKNYVFEFIAGVKF